MEHKARNAALPQVSLPSTPVPQEQPERSQAPISIPEVTSTAPATAVPISTTGGALSPVLGPGSTCGSYAAAAAAAPLPRPQAARPVPRTQRQLPSKSTGGAVVLTVMRPKAAAGRGNRGAAVLALPRSGAATAAAAAAARQTSAAGSKPAKEACTTLQCNLCKFCSEADDMRLLIHLAVGFTPNIQVPCLSPNPSGNVHTCRRHGAMP